MGTETWKKGKYRPCKGLGPRESQARKPRPRQGAVQRVCGTEMHDTCLGPMRLCGKVVSLLRLSLLQKENPLVP